MWIMARCTLNLVSGKCLNPVREFPPTIFGRNSGLIKPLVYSIGREADRNRVVICQVSLQVLQCCIVRTRHTAISACPAVVALTAGISTSCCTPRCHLIVYPCVYYLSAFWLINDCVYSNCSVMT